MSSHHGVGLSPDLQLQSAVQLKYGQTYIENFIEEAGSLPLELQRILLTIKDLDERSTELGAALQSAATRCLELPSACSRFVTREQASEIAALRKRMEEIESLLATYSNEKVQLTLMAYQMVESHINKCDANLSVFEKELRVSGDFVEAATEAADAPANQASGQRERDQHGGERGGGASGNRANERAANPASHGGERRGGQNRSHKSAVGANASVTEIPIKNGGMVCARVNSGPDGCILATVKHVSKDRGEVTVIDEEAESPATAVHKLRSSSVLPLPPRDFAGRALPVGSKVLAMYPGATVFYEATILTSARRSKSGQYASYSVAFKGDAPPGVEVPARQVQFTQVVALTAAADVV